MEIKERKPRFLPKTQKKVLYLPTLNKKVPLFCDFYHTIKFPFFFYAPEALFYVPRVVTVILVVP